MNTQTAIHIATTNKFGIKFEQAVTHLINIAKAQDTPTDLPELELLLNADDECYWTDKTFKKVEEKINKIITYLKTPGIKGLKEAITAKDARIHELGRNTISLCDEIQGLKAEIARLNRFIDENCDNEGIDKFL